MSHLAELRRRFEAAGAADAVAWLGTTTSYAGLLRQIDDAARRLEEGGMAPGTVVALEGDFSPATIALLFALAEREAIIVPLTASVDAKKPEYCELAQVELRVRVEAENVSIEPTGVQANHPLVRRLRGLRHPGLVLFSSGSTGASKGTVHDLSNLLRRGPQRRPRRTLTFLLFDHIGGINSLLDVLANAGCVVSVSDRSPEAVCAAIEAHRVDVLPTTPTFLRLLLLSDAANRFDLSSLELITFGTEPMAEGTLATLRERFPRVRFLQQYGLSEGGILRAHARPEDPLWMRLEGEGLETRIVEGMLEVKSPTAMLGYLNAPDPFTADGWLRTGDSVVNDGDFVRILGRQSEMINIGGEKVFPAEVEGVLEQMDGVLAASVTGEANAILGQILVATVQLAREETPADFGLRMRTFCASRLPRHKVPQKVKVSIASQHGVRHKKMRTDTASTSEAG